ncbi:hypothetical protein [Paenibacillus sp. OV219]|uniref:hypothetical protein n=1 Tax=Paenibacillus sp. OV219 TaxID=1884377 RepID=UPI0008D2CD7C|nr:hypothetical protein [Paenibacillus sp. OV219]SEN94218.1 hypothetical protein SAMN05518847_10516 [Paenibacillus sp. OV219]
MNSTPEEIILIKECCLLPIMLDMLEKQRLEMEKSTSPMKTLYQAALIRLQNTIHADLMNTRNQLREANIKMWKVHSSEVREKSAFKYEYSNKGYRGVFEMLRSLVRAEISKKFGQYIGRVFNNKFSD